MKPYSTDLRTKIIETQEKTNESIQELADRFQVSYSFVNRLLLRDKASQSVEPSPHGGGKPPLINSQQLDIISQLVEADNDATKATIMYSLRRTNGSKSQCSNHVPSLTKIGVKPQKKDSSC